MRVVLPFRVMDYITHSYSGRGDLRLEVVEYGDTFVVNMPDGVALRFNHDGHLIAKDKWAGKTIEGHGHKGRIETYTCGQSLVCSLCSGFATLVVVYEEGHKPLCDAHMKFMREVLDHIVDSIADTEKR